MPRPRRRRSRSPLPTLGLVAHGFSLYPFALGIYRLAHMEPLTSRLELLGWDYPGPCWASGLVATGVGAALISRPAHARWLVPLGLAITVVATSVGAGAVLGTDRPPGPLLAWLPVLVGWLALAVLVWRAREWVSPPPAPEDEAGAPTDDDAG